MALSLLAAAAILVRAWEELVLPGAVVLGLVFAAADVRELVHQLDDSNGGLAAIAAVLTGLHLAVVVLAAALLGVALGLGRRQQQAGPRRHE